MRPAKDDAKDGEYFNFDHDSLNIMPIESPPPRNETCHITHGTSFIDVRGGDGEVLLKLGDAGVALNWIDRQGSIAQYLVRSGKSDFSGELDALRYVLDGHLDPQIQMATQLEPLMQLLAPSRYHLILEPKMRVVDVLDFDSSWKPRQDFSHFYPLDGTLITTRPEDSLSRERVTHFKKLLRGGLCPIVLAVSVRDGYCHYVVDGHHKLAAYRGLGRSPTALLIERLDSPPLKSNAFRDHIAKRHQLARHFVRSF